MAFESRKQFETEANKDPRHEPIGGAHESDPKEVDRYVAINEALDKLDMNGQIDVFEAFKGILDQNKEEYEQDKKIPLMTSEEKMGVLMQMIEEQSRKSKTEKKGKGSEPWSLENQTDPELENYRDLSRTPFLNSRDYKPFPTSRPRIKRTQEWDPKVNDYVFRRKVFAADFDKHSPAEEDIALELQGLIERQEASQAKDMFVQKEIGTSQSKYRRSKGPPEQKPLAKKGKDRDTLRAPGAMIDESQEHDRPDVLDAMMEEAELDDKH